MGLGLGLGLGWFDSLSRLDQKKSTETQKQLNIDLYKSEKYFHTLSGTISGAKPVKAPPRDSCLISLRGRHVFSYDAEGQVLINEMTLEHKPVLFNKLDDCA